VRVSGATTNDCQPRRESCRSNRPEENISAITGHKKAAPARTFATATARQSGIRVAMATSSATAATRMRAIGKCTRSGCKRPISASGYTDRGRPRYIPTVLPWAFGNKPRAIQVLSPGVSRAWGARDRTNWHRRAPARRSRRGAGVYSPTSRRPADAGHVLPGSLPPSRTVDCVRASCASASRCWGSAIAIDIAAPAAAMRAT